MPITFTFHAPLLCTPISDWNVMTWLMTQSAWRDAAKRNVRRWRLCLTLPLRNGPKSTSTCDSSALCLLSKSACLVKSNGALRSLSEYSVVKARFRDCLSEVVIKKNSSPWVRMQAWLCDKIWDPSFIKNTYMAGAKLVIQILVCISTVDPIGSVTCIR